MGRQLFSAALLLAIAAAGTVYYFRHQEEFHLITTVSKGALVGLSALFILISVCYALQLKILMHHYRLDIDFLRCYGLSRASSFLNLFLPFGGGASFKAIYLKRLLDFRYSSFIASMAIANAIKIMVFSLAAMLLVMPAGGILLVVSVALFSASLFSLLYGHKLKRLDVTFSGYLKRIADEWRSIKEDRKTVTKLISLSLLLFTVATLYTYLCFKAFSVDISLPASGTIAAFTTITGLFNLVPGNLGIREALVILISNNYGIGVNESVHAAALGRILQIAWTFLLATFFRYNVPWDSAQQQEGVKE